ncbi:MAG TPA: hypothetical protein ACFCUC_03575 [Desulfobacterales bacterium]
MNEYQQEQYDAFQTVICGLGRLSIGEIEGLRQMVQPYLRFRRELDAFQAKHFAAHCTRQCFRRRLSACCSKDGIVVFFADVAVNVLDSAEPDIDALVARLQRPERRDKCIYLGRAGCGWKLRPIVCAMFLCNRVQQEVLAADPVLQDQWRAFETRRRTFTWPDRPVLFDALEQCFLRLGLRSSLMFLNTGPGLLRVKKKAGLL